MQLEFLAKCEALLLHKVDGSPAEILDNPV
jgi:hypothetical protein